MGSPAVRQRAAKGGSVAEAAGAAEENGHLADKPGENAPSDLTGEWGNLAILLLLYTLQGIPMGLSAVLPMVLKERGVSFSDIGTFSLNSYPFSLKLLWAPIVDTAYVASFGRRKTWMVPTQLLIGVVLLGLSQSIDGLLYVEKPQVLTLTCAFFVLYFLCASQDIAVDGWALTMLRKENRSYAATCNSVGQTLGYALGFTGCMSMEQLQLTTLSGFLGICGVAFIVVTLLVAIFKSEAPVPPDEEPPDVATAYRQMLSVLKLRSVRSLVLVLFTWRAAFAVIDGAAALKFQEYGVQKTHMAYMTSLLMPAYILLPVIISPWTSGDAPLDLSMKAYPWRVLLIPVTVFMLYLTPSSMDPTPWGFYTLIFVMSLAGAAVSQCMFVAQMAFFARISDETMGGTYMTLLNTLANLGGMWPPTVAMKLIDSTTCRGQACRFEADGFYVMAALSFFLGLVWYALGAGHVRRLQHLKEADWRIPA